MTYATSALPRYVCTSVEIFQANCLLRIQHALARKQTFVTGSHHRLVLYTLTRARIYTEHNTTRLRSFLTLMHIQCVAFNPYQESDSSKSGVRAHFSNNLALLVPHKMRQCK